MFLEEEFPLNFQNKIKVYKKRKGNIILELDCISYYY